MSSTTQPGGPRESSAPPEAPLAGVRVVDLADRHSETCGRILADLGADVIRVEGPGGGSSRRREPLVDGESLAFATRNANKRGIVLDLDDGRDRERLLDLVATADVLIETEAPGRMRARGLDAPALLARNPRLVAASITDFGQDGPYRDWVGTQSVHLALAGLLSRSGTPTGEPLVPPGFLAYESAAVQATWAILVAYAHTLETGRGQAVDVSVFEALAQAVDPGYGIGGSAAGGVTASELPRTRPDAGYRYPIFPCADGHVRICLLSPGQWRGMFRWLGEPEEFADPSYDRTGVRFRAWSRISPYIAALFADRTRAELVEQGQALGIPVAGLDAPGEILASEHFAARGAFVDAEVAPGVSGRLPAGFFEVDGARMGFRTRAPELGEHQDDVLPARAPARETGGPDDGEPLAEDAAAARRPLAGLRVLDLGVIVLGAEVSRMLADQGAEVIKIESRSHPDGSRQSLTGEAMTASFAWGHRNKVGLGLDLRTPEGHDLFLRLVERSDVVVSNFKPGTLEKLGLGYDVLRERNPEIVVADSSALGRSGPSSRRMGYGPLVRASTGLTGLWRYPGADTFNDSITIHPDHTAARVVAIGVLARLLRRRRTGTGGTVSVSQAEVILTQMADSFLLESLRPGAFVPQGNGVDGGAPSGVHPCAGDDEWCVVTIRDDVDWRAFATATGRPELAEHPDFATAAARAERREAVDGIITAWTREHPPRQAMTLLQEHGVPAGFMQRVAEYPEDPQLAARGFFHELTQPGLAEPIPTEARPARFGLVPDPPLQPAPMPGEHTREVCARVLGLEASEIEDLMARGVLQETPAAVHA
jgi:crotonobetainyl-CoA:carnitine CoA-transferase CaiB-like acyl-CoA transferase